MSRIFIDMDGTLARFHDEVNYLERMYEPGFFRELHPFSNFLIAVKSNLDKDIYILSSVIESPTCVAEKRDWLKKYLPELPESRQIFCPMGVSKTECIPEGLKPDDILIDDYNKNLTEWRNSGGMAVKFVNNINDRGQIGPRWEGNRIFFNCSAFQLADRLRVISLAADKRNMSVHEEKKKINYKPRSR